MYYKQNKAAIGSRILHVYNIAQEQNFNMWKLKETYEAYELTLPSQDMKYCTRTDI